MILSRNKDDATQIIEALLLISQSETAGEGALCLKQSLDFIKILIKSTPPEVVEIVDTILEEKEEDLQPLEEEKLDKIKGVLKDWAKFMKKKVEAKLKSEKGDDINPRYCPKVATRLLDQIKTIPLWSSICRDNFGYGRVPASSALVESEFKIIKKQIMLKQKRIDEAVKTLIQYYRGKLKLVDCNKQVTDSISSKSPEPKSPEISSNCNITKDENATSPVVFQDREPLKDLSSSFNSIEKLNNLSCMACRNGDFPSGSHTCIICQTNVHILQGCSVQIDEEEEGHG